MHRNGLREAELAVATEKSFPEMYADITVETLSRGLLDVMVWRHFLWMIFNTPTTAHKNYGNFLQELSQLTWKCPDMV